MSEAKEGCSSLEDVDTDTFVRFSEYAYSGDYTVPEPEIDIGASQTATMNGVEGISGNCVGAPPEGPAPEARE